MHVSVPLGVQGLDVSVRADKWSQPYHGGAKGVGELGTVGATPAIVNAVLDALRGNGVSHIDMPLSPQKVWAALQN